MAFLVDTNLNGLDRLVIPKHRADRPDWHTEKGWEKQRHKSMKEHIGEGDVVYYVGAEEGEFPALCSKWGADVVMIEPNPKAWPNIKAIYNTNDIKQPIACIEGFASNEHRIIKEQTELWPDSSDGDIIGDHGFKELYLEANNYNQYKIDVLTRDLPPPTALTFDVEGSEGEVIKGAMTTIKKYKPKIWASLHPEFYYAQWGGYISDLRNIIIDLGYTEEILEYQHELHCVYLPRSV